MKTTKLERDRMRLIRNADSSFIQLCDEIDNLESELRDARQLIEADNTALKKAEAKLPEQSTLLSEVERLSRENRAILKMAKEYERCAGEWMNEFDRLKNKYELMTIVLSSLDKDNTK